jgi:uncharacterized protein (TIGR02147 family)
MNQDPMTYQRFILSEFEGRRQRNARYSLRAFARDLGLAAPKLSEILRGKSGLSSESAQRLAPKLGLSAAEAETFVSMVQAKHARASRDREAAKSKLSEMKQSHQFNELSLESFRIISDWWHFAILELTEVNAFRSSTAWIAKRLGLSESVAKEAVQRLFDFGLLAKTEDGTWYQTNAILATPQGVPSAEIRKHHRQILAKADESLTKSPITERDLSSMTLSMSEEDFLEVQEEIKQFRRRLSLKIAKAKTKNRVYTLAIQFFPLDQKESQS